MELPFAVETQEQRRQRLSAGGGASNNGRTNTMNQSVASDSSSLVMASSQGSFMNSSDVLDGLPPNTPQDVVLHYDNIPHHHQPSNQYQHQQQHHNPQSRHHHQHQHPRQQQQQQQQPHHHHLQENEIVDFTYVNVCETDADEVDIVIEGSDSSSQKENQRGDVLAVLVSGVGQQNDNDNFLEQSENANEAAMLASEAKKNGELKKSFNYHAKAAKIYKNIAMEVKERNAPLANSLLLLSQTQAKSALALKRIVELKIFDLERVIPEGNDRKEGTTTLTQKERLRAAVRGALHSHHRHEEDITDSAFLGRASSEPTAAPSIAPSTAPSIVHDTINNERGTLVSSGSPDDAANPVDDMMELERELRDMDMALELGNSISSLDARMQHRMKNSLVEGSFMVVPPGSNSYMSSTMWGSGHIPNNTRPSSGQPPPAPRARANRVQNMLEASAVRTAPSHPSQGGVQVTPKAAASGLDSSWWGNTSSTASQVLASSVMSIDSKTGIVGTPAGDNMNETQGGQLANAKQLMRLMDSLKTLGDENAALLREVEEAEAARAEAKAAREQMKRFKSEYGKRFASLKEALEKFRKGYPESNDRGANPVASSEFLRSASTTEQLQRQEQLIRKLTSDLKKEKEESKKKDAALRKYESFYREVKARSAQKAAQRQKESKPLQKRPPTSGTTRVSR